ncbi:MAG: RluA family pseudouridine synthase [Clostridia bacterium]|nr:RluA family pseudouridine synthase [Clostridia bacterium]
MIEILYQDEHIVVCRKEAGMLSEEASTDESLPFMLKKALNTDIYTLHRLDKPVGGVMIYAKTKQAAARFSQMIASDGLYKKYIAVLDSVPEKDSDELCDFLFKDSRKNKVFVVKKMRKGVKEASLSYRTIAKENNHALVEIELKTGRSHQIRVQFASRKMPLTGDGKYGSRDNRCTVALFSHEISFIHPFTKESVSFKAEPDYSVYPWNMFRTE